MMPTLLLSGAILALLFCANNNNNNHAAAFMIPSPFNRQVTTLSLSSMGGDNSSNRATPFTAIEVQEMDSLILSLSLEPTDTSRRQRLASVFAEELAKADCKRFADLFDQVLAIVGDRVQVNAKKKALAQQRDAAEEQDDSTREQDEKENDNDGDFMGMGRSPEERQLWALVDMMVQSKTIAKKKFGELGNRGTLQ